MKKTSKPDVVIAPGTGAEDARLADDSARKANWKRWGPYLAERQWGTVREDYSADGSAWQYFPHSHSRSRAYRWGEDGLLGISDRQARLCFALALWNTRDPILKERTFGLSGPQGNHGEDVKELYYFVDATPTHSYLKGLYRYPQREYPYRELIDADKGRSKLEPERELIDAGMFDDERYFDITVEYAKESPDDILIRIGIANRSADAAPLEVLPQLWFRNTWTWGESDEDCGPKPSLRATADGRIEGEQFELGPLEFRAAAHDGQSPELLFTENETNVERLFGDSNPQPFVKDAFHEYVIHGRSDAINPAREGTKAAARYRLIVPARGSVELRMRLRLENKPKSHLKESDLGRGFERTFAQRIAEADEYFATRIPSALSADERNVVRQAYAGLAWSKQFYHYVVPEWLEGDPTQPPPPPERKSGRNSEWTHIYNRDVISMPDTWEYPWYAAWDLAFHMIPFAHFDADFAKGQLELFLREWYMHPNGQIPAYEWSLSDVNPPVHAWACWRVYKKTGAHGKRDRRFLASCFQKLLLNFTWWVNRKDAQGRHVFSGGFLGMDNISVFDRSQPLPTGGHLEQADGTAWMAFYCGTMLSMALELAREDAAYEDMASKFFEHYVHIADAMNTLGGSGLWSEQDGFYYDQIHLDGAQIPLKIRSMVGLIPLYAVEILEMDTINRLPGFKKRLRWFLDNRPDLTGKISYLEAAGTAGHRLLAIPSRNRLERVLRYLLDENEFLSPYGIRSVSKVHRDRPYLFRAGDEEYRVEYVPGESDTGLFGGNSNWRGPIWMPVNYLLIEALERYHHFYGDSLKVECPIGSGRMMTLGEVSRELSRRLARIFLPDGRGARPCHGGDRRYAEDPHWRDLVLFHESFHGDSGRGVGASHQTGWTALVARVLEGLAKEAAHGHSEPPLRVVVSQR